MPTYRSISGFFVGSQDSVLGKLVEFSRILGEIFQELIGYLNTRRKIVKVVC